MTASLLSAIVVSTVATAHESGVKSLGSGSGATDFYQVSCFNDGSGDASFLEVQLQDLAPKPSPDPLISIQVIKGIKAANATDLVDGDTGLSKIIQLKGGNGTYLILVDKTRAGGENYQFTYHCETATNVHTGTNPLVTVQNQ